MTELQNIKSEVASLSHKELAQFCAWLDEIKAARFDQRIESDARTRGLVRIVEQAKHDHAKGRIVRCKPPLPFQSRTL